ncbi:hypothetical protein CDAR_578901 [Caerostris darwini]|uniref:Uncharacterized protein n=1 Tax=Caerostris darwini TaxID=1538125 RepID=A0AAV4RQT6_9ARAC|nr:hypothetical protein CDAR_578901 [Caerostris darwini]
MNLDAKLYGAKIIPYANVKRFFQETLPQIEFNKNDAKDVVLDVGCGPGGCTPTVKKWKGQITKLVSIYCLHWLEDTKKGFQNIHRLLKPGGKAAICFVMQSIFYDAMKEMENSKWRSFYKDVGDYLPDSHVNKRKASYYEQMVKEVGFEILHLKRRVNK